MSINHASAFLLSLTLYTGKKFDEIVFICKYFNENMASITSTKDILIFDRIIE